MSINVLHRHWLQERTAPARNIASLAIAPEPVKPETIDLRRFVDFEPDERGLRYRTAGERGGATGTMIGVIRLRHSNGFEILLRDDQGRLSSHSPHALFPAGKAPRS